MSRLRKVLTYLAIAAVAFMGALNYQLFVFPNQFAPAGLNGICTMIQHLSGISVGYLSLLINIPLAILVFFQVRKALAVRSMVYVAVFSVALVVLDKIDLSGFTYYTANGTSIIMGPLVAGIINGFCYSVLVKGSAYSGGMDFVACLIHKHRPDFNIFWTIFVLNVTVASFSFFVYGYKIEPVLMCILYSFTTSTVSDKLQKAGLSAVRFEIVTQEPEIITKAIVEQFHHTATLIPGKGIYKGTDTNVLICIVNKSQAAALSAFIRECPHTFAVMSQVGEVMGNFKHLDNRGRIEPEFFDRGEVDNPIA